MAARSRYLTLEAWAKGLVTFEALDSFSRLRESLVTDYLLMERAQTYWHTRTLAVASMVDKVKDGWGKLGQALERFSEAVYPWEVFERLELEVRDPKAAARKERERLLTGIEAGIERYVFLVETGELAPGTEYASWKAAYQLKDPELFERVRKAIEEQKANGSADHAAADAAPNPIYGGNSRPR